MCPDPDIDMIGAQDIEDEVQLHIGHGHVIYVGGVKGTDALADEIAKQFGMQVEVLVPPNHPRAQYVSPSTVEVLVLANLHLHQAAHKLCKRVPSHFYTLQLLQRNYQIAKKAHTIFAFGILNKDDKRVKGGTGWTVQLALDQGKEVYLFDIPSQTWYRSENHYYVSDDSATLAASSYPGVSNPSPFIKAVLWLVPEIWTRKPERKSKPYAIVPSVFPRTLNNYEWNWKTFICKNIMKHVNFCEETQVY